MFVLSFFFSLSSPFSACIFFFSYANVVSPLISRAYDIVYLGTIVYFTPSRYMIRYCIRSANDIICHTRNVVFLSFFSFVFQYFIAKGAGTVFLSMILLVTRSCFVFVFQSLRPNFEILFLPTYRS